MSTLQVLRLFIPEIILLQMNRFAGIPRGVNTVVALGLIAGLSACSKAPARTPRPAIAVNVIAVKRAAVPYDIDANGIVTPMQTAVVSPQVDGIITEVNFSEGQNVTKGQILFHLDPRPYKAAFDQATAALARDKATASYAQLEADRYEGLVKQGIVTREQSEQFRTTAQSTAATVQADQATVDNAKFNLDNTIIHAPISGRTGSLLVRTGNLVHGSSGTPLVLINQVSPTLVRFAVPAAQLPLILKYGEKDGRPVGLPVKAIPGSLLAASAPADTTKPMDATASGGGAPGTRPVALAPSDADLDSNGAMSMIENQVDTTTATVMLKATFANKHGTLWAGQFVATSLRLFVEDNALVLPAQAVVTGQQGTYVYVIDSSNTAQQRPVTVERTAGQISVISAGLSEGERVVTDGQSRVTPGAQVTIGARDASARGAAGGGGGGGGRGGRGRGGRGGRGKAGGADSSAAKPPAK
jgi:multidrug efflux system membrane fusion protein